MDIKEKLKAMREAKCSIKECEENQAFWLGLPSPISPEVQETFPFCINHFNQINFGKLKRFVLKNGLAPALRRKDWANFARGYYGPGYAENRYDDKMASAYASFKGAM